MKLLVVLSLLTLTLSCMADTTAAKKTLPVDKSEKFVKAEKVKAKEVGAKAEEDCDEKAKKPIVIKEETISLSGNTGCSIDEMKK